MDERKSGICGGWRRWSVAKGDVMKCELKLKDDSCWKLLFTFVFDVILAILRFG